MLQYAYVASGNDLAIVEGCRSASNASKMKLVKCSEWVSRGKPWVVGSTLLLHALSTLPLRGIARIAHVAVFGLAARHWPLIIGDHRVWCHIWLLFREMAPVHQRWRARELRRNSVHEAVRNHLRARGRGASTGCSWRIRGHQIGIERRIVLVLWIHGRHNHLRLQRLAHANGDTSLKSHR